MATPLADATAGAIGSALANTLVFPLDVVKTRMQVQNKVLAEDEAYKTTSGALKKIFKEEGIPGLYAGLKSGLAGTVVSAFSYYYIYSSIRGRYHKSIGMKDISTQMELFLGAVAGALCQFIVLPIGIVTTRQQTTSDKKSFYQTLSGIVKEEGFPELWKGLRASLVLCSNPAITFGVFERLKTLILNRSGDPKRRLTSGQIFLIGAIAKTLATVFTYPYIMAKVKMQWKAPKDSLDKLSDKEREMIKYKSAYDILLKVYHSEGLIGWYTGMSAQILKAVLCQAIVFTLKEELSSYTNAFFAIFEAKAT